MLASHRLRMIGLTVVLCAIVTSACSAQSDSGRVSTDPPTASAADTTSVLGTSGFVMTRSPTLATALSVIPGAGQVYNQQYIKAALFAGVGAFFVVQALRFNASFVEKADAIDALPFDDSTTNRVLLKSEREFYRDNRDLNIAYFIAVELLSMIDAYVGAHLFDFDVDGGDEGLTSRLYVDPSHMAVGVTMRW